MKPSKHSGELAGAILEDSRRQAIDAAKKRAVAQQADYDTFKKLVSVAHLKPVSAPSGRRAGIDSLAWRLDSTGALQAAAVANNATQLLCHSQPRAVHAITHESSQCHKRLEATEQQHVLPTTSCGTSISNKQSPTAEQFSVPSSSHLFLMQWRRHCPTAADKYRLLKLCGAEHVTSLFKVEISGELLSQVLMVLQQESLPRMQCIITNAMTSCSNSPVVSAAPVQLEEARFVVQLLYGLTGVGRFDLSSRLISRSARQAAVQLCSNMTDVLRDLPHALHQAADGLDGELQQQAAGTDNGAVPGAKQATSCTTAVELDHQHQHVNEWIVKLMHIQDKLHV